MIIDMKKDENTRGRKGKRDKMKDRTTERKYIHKKQIYKRCKNVGKTTQKDNIMKFNQ